MINLWWNEASSISHAGGASWNCFLWPMRAPLWAASPTNRIVSAFGGFLLDCHAGSHSFSHSFAVIFCNEGCETCLCSSPNIWLCVAFFYFFVRYYGNDLLKDAHCFPDVLAMLTIFSYCSLWNALTERTVSSLKGEKKKKKVQEKCL